MPLPSTPQQHVVVAAFLHDKGEVLLAKRTVDKNIAPGKFHLPGGHVELGEHPVKALQRELREELNIETRACEPLWIFDYVWKSTHTIGVVFCVPLNTRRECLRWNSADIERCLWVAEPTLCRYLSPDDHNCQAAKAGFKHLSRKICCG